MALSVSEPQLKSSTRGGESQSQLRPRTGAQQPRLLRIIPGTLDTVRDEHCHNRLKDTHTVFSSFFLPLQNWKHRTVDPTAAGRTDGGASLLKLFPLGLGGKLPTSVISLPSVHPRDCGRDCG